MKRIASIDILRALTMLMMIFVNDFAGMSGLPHWLHHASFNEDMLGFSDLVFPGFLFCVGLSIPFAIGARYRRGDVPLQILGHILLRTLALIVMGVFAMNFRGVEGGLSRPVFILLSIAGFFLVWNIWPRGKDGRYPVWVRILQGIGVALLAGLVIYKDIHGMPFRHGWWGILGLIGWAYLPSALAYLFLKGDFKKLMAFWLLTLLLCVLNATPAIPAEYSSRALILGFWPGGWTHPAICASGMFASLLFIRLSENPRRLLISLFSYMAAMIVLGLLCHRFWIISKLQATPTWLCFCVAISVAAFAVFYWLADVKNAVKPGSTGHLFYRLIAPAGTATLTCYMMPTIWSAVQQLLGLHWPEALTSGIPGLIKALVFAFLIIGLTWIFERIHLKLKI